MAPQLIKSVTKLPKLGVATGLRGDPLKTAELVAGVGATVARFDATWSTIEQTKGNYGTPFDAWVAALSAKAILPLAILCYGHKDYTGGEKIAPTTTVGINGYVAYCKATVLHFKTRCHYELWNEPNLPGFWPSTNPVEYGLCARSAATEMKAAVPGCTIILGGIAANNSPTTHADGTRSTVELDYITKAVSAIDKSKIDYVGYHPYNGADAYASNPLMRPEGMSNRMDAIRIAAGGIPVIGTESGFENTKCQGTTQADKLDRQGILTHRWCAEVLSGDAPYGIYYNLVDKGIDPLNKEYNFGLYDTALNMKPSGKAFKQWADLANSSDSAEFWRDGDIFWATFKNAQGTRKVTWNGGALGSTILYNGVAYSESKPPVFGPLVPNVVVPFPDPVITALQKENADLRALAVVQKATIDASVKAVVDVKNVLANLNVMAAKL